MSKPLLRRQTLAEDPRVAMEPLGYQASPSLIKLKTKGVLSNNTTNNATTITRRNSIAGYLKDFHGEQESTRRASLSSILDTEEGVEQEEEEENTAPKLDDSAIIRGEEKKTISAATALRLTQRRQMHGKNAQQQQTQQPMRRRSGSFGNNNNNSVPITGTTRTRANSLDNNTFEEGPTQTTTRRTIDFDILAGPRSSMYILQERRDWSSQGMLRGVRRVIEFLATRGYGRDISEQALVNPTVATFRDVLAAMVSLMNPTLSEEILAKARVRSNWETNACTFFRQARYSFQLSPKQINAVGSANAWPKFLGALTWLADLYDADDAIQETLASGDRERWTLFEFLQNAYSSYMEGDDAAIERVLGKLRVDVDRQIKECKKKFDDALAKVAKLETELTRLQADDGDVDVSSLEEKLETLQEDVKKYQSVIAAWETKRRATSAKLEAALQEEKQGVARLKAANENKAQTRALLDGQALSSDDVQRILAERDRVTKAHGEAVKQKQLATLRVAKVQEEIKKAMETLTRQKQDFGFRVESLLGTKVVTTNEEEDIERIQTKLVAFREQLLIRAHEARQRTLDLQDTANRNRDERAEIEARIEKSRAAAKRADERHRLDMEGLKSELGTLEQETLSVQESLDQHKSSTKSTEEFETELANLRFEIEEENATFQRVYAEYDEGVHAALAIMVGLKEDVEGLTAVLSNTVMESRNAVGTMITNSCS